MRFIGSKLRQLREDSGELQKDVAAKLDMWPSILSGYENGKTPDLSLLTGLAKHYQVSFDYLVGFIDHRLDPLDPNYQELIALYHPLSREQKTDLIKEMRLKYGQS